MREQRRDHPGVAAHDRGVQRREAGGGGVRIGATLEQELDDLGEAGVRRHHRGADAPRIGVVDVRAGGDEQLRRLEIADARGEHQRRVAAVRNRPVVLRQAVRRHRHHLAPHVRARVHVGAVREQHLDDVRMPSAPTAHISAVWPRAPRALTLAPLASSSSTTSALPEREADHQRRFAERAARGSDWRRPRAAASTIGALPFRLAFHSGVAPRSLAALTLAPARISRSTLSRSSR